MMQPLVSSALGLLLAAICVIQIRKLLARAALARRLGCKPLLREGDFDPSGVGNTIRGIRAARKSRFLDYLQDRFDTMQRRTGRAVWTMGFPSLFFETSVFTIDPSNVQAVLATKFNDFKLGVDRTDNFRALFGNGIFTSNGEQWQHSRALLRPQFVRSQVSNLDIEEKHVQALMTVLEKHVVGDGWTSLLDLQKLFFRLTLDSATEFLFGQSVDSQLGHDSPQTPGAIGDGGFAHAFDASQFTLAWASRLGSLYWLMHTAVFKRNVETVNSFVHKFVEMAMRQGLDQEKKETQSKETYIFLNALTRDTQDPEELRSQLLNILLAGRDTTGSVLSWFFYTLAEPQNRHIFQRLREVILEDFGTYANPKITFEGMKNCQYLQWCLNEILRIYPPVPVNGRTAERDTCLPKGGGPQGQDPIFIKKGQIVIYSVQLMHRCKDIWGPDAREFRPERWRDRRPGWDYLPFNGGPRICIGQQYALTEIAYVVIRLLQRIDSLDGSRSGPVKYRLTLTSFPADGVNLRLHFTDD